MAVHLGHDDVHKYQCEIVVKHLTQGLSPGVCPDELQMRSSEDRVESDEIVWLVIHHQDLDHFVVGRWRHAQWNSIWPSDGTEVALRSFDGRRTPAQDRM